MQLIVRCLLELTYILQIKFQSKNFQMQNLMQIFQCLLMNIILQNDYKKRETKRVVNNKIIVMEQINVKDVCSKSNLINIFLENINKTIQFMKREQQQLIFLLSFIFIFSNYLLIQNSFEFKMGQQQYKQSSELSLNNFKNKFTIQNAFPDSNIQILISKENSNVYLMKQLSMTSTDDFNAMVQKIKKRKDLKFDHYLSIQEFYTKSQNSFCSTFHRISLIYQYSDHNLLKQIETRINQDRKFEEKQIWSIICSCSLALAYLFRNNITYPFLSPEQIFLTVEGVIKLGDPEISVNNTNGLMIRMDQYYSPQFLKNSLTKQSDKGCIFSLGMCILHAMILQSMSSCYNYQQLRFNQKQLNAKLNKIKSQGYSQALISVIERMIAMKSSQRFGVIDLELYLKQLVETAETEDQEEQLRKISDRVQKIQIQQTQLEKEIISNPIPSMDPQIQEQSDTQCLHFFEDNQNPDQSQDKQEQVLTERSNNLMLTQTYAKIIESKTNQTNIDNSNTKQNSKINQEESNKKQLNINTKETIPNISIEKLSTPKLVAPASHKEGILFTDPKLMEMLKQDLEIINLKKSKIHNEQEQRISFSGNDVSNKESRSSIIRQSTNSFTKQSIEQMLNNQIKMPSSKRSPRVSDNFLDNSSSQNLYNNFSQRIPEADGYKNAFSKKKKQPEIEGLKFVNQQFSKGRYQGQKLGNCRHGYGSFYYKQGGKYTGYWFDNKMHGKGTLYYSNNKVAYQGQWKQDRLCGFGILYNEDPQILQTRYDYTSWNDINQYWIKYEGNFLDDNKSGKGKLYLSNRQIFEGIFEDDEANGQGIFYKLNGQTIRGIWKQNILIKQL